jgi:hypothetical protein
LIITFRLQRHIPRPARLPLPLLRSRNVVNAAPDLLNFLDLIFQGKIFAVQRFTLGGQLAANKNTPFIKDGGRSMLPVASDRSEICSAHNEIPKREVEISHPVQHPVRQQTLFWRKQKRCFV